MGIGQQDDKELAEEVAFEIYYEEIMMQKYENEMKYFLGVFDE